MGNPFNIDAMYEPDARDRRIFGDRYRPPKRFRHGRWHHVATIRKQRNGDGQSVKIDESRIPARCFRLRVLSGPDSVGRTQAAYEVTTGSGDEMGALLVQVAEQIALGMLGFHRVRTAKGDSRG